MTKEYKRSPETRRKMSEAAKRDGRRPPSRKGIKHTEEWKRNNSELMKGRTFSEETMQRKIASVRRGVDCHFWKGGITPLKLLIRQSFKYRQWRSRIYERDNFICQECGGSGGRLNADHIKSFSLILEENNIKTLEDAKECNELWDLGNGRTLCEDCHKQTDNFGRKGRVSYQQSEVIP